MRAASKYCGIGSQYHAIACSRTEVDNDDNDGSGIQPKIDFSLKSNMAPLHCSSESEIFFHGDDDDEEDDDSDIYYNDND